MNNHIKYKLNPNWVTDLVYVKGCFYVRIIRSKNHKTG